MKSVHNSLRVLAVTVLLCTSFVATTIANAAEQRTAAATTTSNSTAATVKKNAVPVYVELEGTDTIGSRLAFLLRERFNTSSQFALTSKEQPKFLITIATKPEFESRPAVGSAYSIVWLHFTKNSAYSSYLIQDVGTVSPEDIEGLVDQLVERTLGISVKYSYLFD